MAETKYSTPEEIDAFITRLVEGNPDNINENGVTDKRRPMIVLNMDGNFVIGYKPKPGVSFTLAEDDNPERQSIPSDADVQELLSQGRIEPTIFAKSFDVRVHPDIARLLNENIADDAHPDRKFDIAILTSRSTENALKTLRMSGIEHPENLTMVADSGGSMFIGGKRYDVRPLSTEEKNFLQDVARERSALEAKIDNILVELKLNPAGRPKLYLEEKGIASNLHYRNILEHYNQKEGSELDKAISAAIRSRLEYYIAQKSPKENGAPVFRLLDAPATIELRIAQIDKGKGLRAVVEAAIAADYTPSAVIFSGDDVNKMVNGKPSPGTDHAAFLEIPKIQEETGIPAFTMHTHHPFSGKIGDKDAVPHPGKAASHAGVKPDLIVRDPQANAEIVMEITERARARAEEVAENASLAAAATPRNRGR